MYQELLEKNMPSLVSRLYELYGGRWDFYKIVSRLEGMMKKASLERSSGGYLSELDKEAVASADENPWYLSGKAVGIMLYVDLFAGNLRNLAGKIPYLKELGVNYVHLMPLFDCPKGENDGGYAISSYRKVQPRLGTIDDLKFVADEFHKNGIRLVLDFVFNHTSDEHVWAKKARAGDVKFRDFYYIYKDKSEDYTCSVARPIRIGRNVGSFPLNMEDMGVSRRHCEIFYNNDDLMLKDYSSNGTPVNSKIVHNTEYKLTSGDKLVIGEHTVIITF